MKKRQDYLNYKSFWVVLLLAEANFQPIRNTTTQIWVVTHHQYGISVLVSQTLLLFCGENSNGDAKCRLFHSQFTPIYFNISGSILRDDNKYMYLGICLGQLWTKEGKLSIDYVSALLISVLILFPLWFTCWNFGYSVILLSRILSSNFLIQLKISPRVNTVE